MVPTEHAAESPAETAIVLAVKEAAEEARAQSAAAKAIAAATAATATAAAAAPAVAVAAQPVTVTPVAAAEAGEGSSEQLKAWLRVNPYVHDGGKVVGSDLTKKEGDLKFHKGPLSTLADAATVVVMGAVGLVLLSGAELSRFSRKVVFGINE